MYRQVVNSALKWLLSHVVIAASTSFLLTLLLTGLGWIDPAILLRATTFGPRHVTGPFLDRGVAFGIDEGILIFAANMMVAVTILSIIFWVHLLNPSEENQKFSLLRKIAQKDRTAEHLLKIPYFARIKSAPLRLSAFILLCAPYMAAITLGVLTGTLLGSTYLLSSSVAIAIAFILPHGLPEITAILITCSIPLGMWLHIQPGIRRNDPSTAFHSIAWISRSQELQQDLKLIINLLLIAGLVEAHFTLEIVNLLIGS